MDWADDIAYSVHDLADFYRVGLVPLHELARSERVRQKFLDRVMERWIREQKIAEDEFKPYEEAFHAFAADMSIFDPYIGVRSQRAALRDLTSAAIDRYIRGAEFRKPEHATDPYIKIAPRLKAEVAMLKELTWHYVILNPSLATQQYGKRRMIEELFEIYEEAAEKGEIEVFPPRIQEDLDKISGSSENEKRQRLRLIADTISSMTDQEACLTYGKLTGYQPGSIVDPLPY